jgi:hypothetical protein
MGILFDASSMNEKESAVEAAVSCNEFVFDDAS